MQNLNLCLDGDLSSIVNDWALTLTKIIKIVWFHDFFLLFRYEFCILCNCTFHEENPCRITRGCKMKNSILAGNSNLNNPTSPSSSTTSSSSSGNYSKARVSSKVSKRRLKRLWQQNYFSKFLFYYFQLSELYFCTNYFFFIKLIKIPIEYCNK